MFAGIKESGRLEGNDKKGDHALEKTDVINSQYVCCFYRTMYPCASEHGMWEYRR